MDFYSYPWKLLPNKISRYPGGRELDRFRGIFPGKDDFCPEGWIGSDTPVINADMGNNPYLGCSECILPDGVKRYLFDAVRECPEKALGKRHMSIHGERLGVLVKLLDAQHQLGLQTHPTRQYAAERFNSPYGKEESWYIIGLRDDCEEPPYVLLGFKDGVTREMFAEHYDKDDIKAMESCCHKIPVQLGDAFIIKAGLPHAIGCGCFMVEVQESSDITVGAHKLKDADVKKQEAHRDRLLGCYIYNGCDAEENLRRYHVAPKVIRKGIWGEESLIIGKDQTEYFSFTRVDAVNCIDLIDTGFFRIMIVLDGDGSIECGNGTATIPITKGDEFFLPCQANQLRLQPHGGRLSVILCNPAGVEL